MIEMSSTVLDTGSGRVLRGRQGLALRWSTEEVALPNAAKPGAFPGSRRHYRQRGRHVHSGAAARGRVLRRGGAPAARCGVPGAAVRGGAARAGIRSPRLRHRTVHGSRLGTAATAVLESERLRTARRGHHHHAHRAATRDLPRLPGRAPRHQGPRRRGPAPGSGHRVQAPDLGGWLAGQLGFDPRSGVTVRAWLAVPSQRLAEVTAGAVFHDGPGELSRARTRLEWYPRDVWRYVLSCQWLRIAQEEAFPGRCAEVGDELGSAVVTARLARDLMRLWLLMNRRYPPYNKWLGTALSRVPGTAPLAASLAAALAATDWHHRERHLVQAYVTVVEAHNTLGLTEPLDPACRRYYDRPFQVPDAGRFAAALTEMITAPVVRRLPPIGAADQFMDSTDALGELRYPRAVIAAG